MFCPASTYQEVHVVAKICMPHAIQIRQTGGPEVLNWTILYSKQDFVAEVSRISGGEKLPAVFDSVGKDTFLCSLDCLRPRGLMVTFGQASVPIDPIAPVPQEFAMSKTAITSPELAPPVGPFSQAIEVGGFLYFSGQVGQDPATGKVVEGGIVAETERVFRNLSAVLKAAGKSFDHVARAGVYLTSMSDFVAMNGIYAKYFSQPFPARTTIGVAALPLGACVEIDLVVKG